MLLNTITGKPSKKQSLTCDIKNKTMKTKIYGASDDLIEINGAVTDEVNDYTEKPITFAASDGTEGTIKYNDEGIWEIDVLFNGSRLLQHIKAVGDDSTHTEPDAVGCSSYSDVLVLDEGIEWVKIGRKTFKK